MVSIIIFGLARKFNLMKNGLNPIRHLKTANINKIRVVLQGQLDKLHNQQNYQLEQLFQITISGFF